jgi:hypothetical protein
MPHTLLTTQERALPRRYVCGPSTPPTHTSAVPSSRQHAHTWHDVRTTRLATPTLNCPRHCNRRFSMQATSRTWQHAPVMCTPEPGPEVWSTCCCLCITHRSSSSDMLHCLQSVLQQQAYIPTCCSTLAANSSTCMAPPAIRTPTYIHTYMQG